MYNMYGQNYNPNYNQNNNLYNPNPVQQTPDLQYYLNYQKTLENNLNQVNSVIAQYQPQQVPQQIPQQQNQQGLSPQQQAMLELEALIDRSVKANLAQMQASKPNETSIRIIQAVGSNLSHEDQLWLSANMEQFADFVMTPEGKDVVSFVLDSYKSYHGIDVTKA